MRNTRDTGLTFALPLLLALTLGACGSDDDGGQSSSSSSSSSSSASYSGGIDNAGNTGGISGAEWPDLNLESTQPKQLHFSWTAVQGADHYELYKNVDGASGYELVADNLTSPEAVDTIAVHQHDWHNATYQVTACLDPECTESENSDELVTLSAMLDTIGFAKASNTDEADWFGWSLALSSDGTTLAVGASREASSAQGVNGDQSNNEVFGAGAVYVFRLENGLWIQEAYLKASNTEAPATNDEGDDITRRNDRFGYQVDIDADGDVIAVSAPFEDGNGTGVNPAEDDNTGLSTGAVYVFKRDENGWAQNALLKASNADPVEEETADDGTTDEEDSTEDDDVITLPSNAGDQFGRDLALSEDGLTLSVSAPFERSSATGVNGDESLNDITNAGAVYVFTDNGTSWAQQAYVKASNTRPSQLFGTAVALSSDGNTMAVGAPLDSSAATGINGDEENAEAPSTGAVFVFDRSGDEWTQEAYIKPSHTYTRGMIAAGLGQLFGSSVALSSDGNSLAVGSPGDISNGTGTDSSPDDYELTDQDSAAPFSGAVYLFKRDGDGWSQTNFLKASNSRTNLRFGATLSLSGDGSQLAVGNVRESSAETGINGDATDTSVVKAGAVYYFTESGGDWVESAYVKSPVTEEYDSFGQAVDLSSDGTTMAVGSHRDDSNATGINGDRNNNDARDSGAVFLY